VYPYIAHRLTIFPGGEIFSWFFPSNLPLVKYLAYDLLFSC
jgi:hypothetical protein